MHHNLSKAVWPALIAVFVALVSRSAGQQPLGRPLPPIGDARYQALEQRLDAYESELQWLRSELQQRHLTQSYPAAANLAAEAGASEPKEIPIQTKPSHKFRGRLFLDHIMMSDLENAAAVFPEDNFTGFDTIRLGVTGNIFENLAYTAEFEFEGGEVDYKDIYAQFENLPWLGNLKIGHYKEPFGLEELVSSRFDTFMEQSVATINYAPTRNVGITAFNDVRENENLTWFLGVFRGGFHDNATGRGADGVAGSGDANDTAVTGRLVWLPYYDEATPGRCLFHVGTAASSRRVGNDPDEGGNGQLEGFLELDSRDGPIDTFLPAGTEFNLFGTELAWVRGPFHIVNEFFFLDARVAGANVDPWGTYIEIGYFLTGENRGYNRSAKAFDRVKPYEDFFAVRTADGVCRGWGAWQVVSRWSYSDLTDTGLAIGGGDARGRQQNLQFGVNWYLNPYCRVMCDYVHSISDVTSGALALGEYEGDHLGMRFQVDW